MSLLVLAPVVIPLSAAALGLLAWGSLRGQQVLTLAASALLLIAGLALLVVVDRDGILSVQLGDWPAPHGITFVADRFSAILVVLTGVLGLAAVVYSIASVDEDRLHHGYLPILLVLLTGVCGTFLTGDLFNLFVWFEVLLIASFVLLALGGERRQLEGAIKYVALNLIASALLLIAIGVLYGLAGTLNLADLSVRLADIEGDGIVPGTSVLLLVAFGIKAGMAPLYFWLPASYHTPPVAVAAIFSGLLTKVGIYALVRTYTLVLPGDAASLQPLILALAALTMVVGVLGAVAQHEIRRLLSFHVISQIGYLVMGLGLFTVSALAGLIYFLVHVAIAKATLFLVGGVVARLTGSFELAASGGLYAARPALAVLFGVAALSLAGIPPFSGFLAKLALVQAGLAVDQLAIVGVSLGVSVLTLYSMLKIWNAAFWKPHPAMEEPAASVVHEAAPAAAARGRVTVGAGMIGPVVFLVACSLLLALAAGPTFELMDRAAEQLMDPSAYVEAVLPVSQP